MDTQSLLQSLDPVHLTAQASPLVLWNMGISADPEVIAQFMYQGGPFPPQASAKVPRPEREDRRPDRKYWDFVKAEMHTFLCTNDRKYQPLWKKLKASSDTSTTAIVGIIATFLSQSLGVVSTLLTGFVAVCLYAAIKLGKEAYCNYTASGA